MLGLLVRSRLLVAAVSLSMLTMLVPATGTMGDASSLGTDEQNIVQSMSPSAGVDAIEWEQAPAAPAAVAATGVGASENAAILSTEMGDGTFVSKDNAHTWEKVNAHGINAGSVEFDPTNPDVAYVGGFDGLARTTDGGQTFEHIVEANNVPAMDVGPGGTVAIAVPVDGFDTDIWISEDQGETWEDVGWPSDRYTLYGLEFGQSDDNLVAVAFDESWVTHDGGETWSHDAENGARTLTANADGTLWRAGAGDLERSTDGGDSWTSVDAPTSFLEISARPGGGIFAASSDGIFVTEDGESWTNMGAPEVGWGATGLVADPQNPDAVIVSDNHIGASWLGPVDGEDAYAYEGRTTGLPFVEVTALASAPDGSMLLAGTPHGLYGSEAGSDTFPHLGAAMGMAWVGAVAAAPGGENLYVGGQSMIFQAFLVSSQDGGNTWQATLPISDDSATRDIEVHPSDEEKAWTGVWIEFDDDTVFETNDAGESWEPVFEIPEGQLLGLAYDERSERLLVSTNLGLYAYDETTGLSVLVSPASSTTIAASEDHAYADGLVESVWSDNVDPTGAVGPFTPWASPADSVEQLAATSAGTEHVIAQTAGDELYHCAPDGEASGACTASPLPDGEANVLAAANGLAYAGTAENGIYQASLD